MQRHIGIYSGTFDPVHLGHILFAQKAREICELDQVLFLPEHTPRHKSNITHIQHRLAMLKLALADEPAFKPITLASAQFTVQETLPQIQKLAGDAQITMLLGSDVAKTLPFWPDIALLLSAATLAIGVRSGDEAGQIEAALRQLPHQPVYTFIATDHAHMASSNVRHGRGPQHLQANVAAYIHQNVLYGSK